MNLFLIASRLKTRFPSSIGELRVEQLWDLPLTSAKAASLDDVGRRLLAELRTYSEESLIDNGRNAAKAATERSIEIVKTIIETKQAEAQAARQKTLNVAQKAKLLDALARKQDSALEQMSEAEIKAAIQAL